MQFTLSTILILSILARAKGYLSDLTTAEKLAKVINKAAKDDSQNNLRNSKFLNKAMDQLNVEFINPYNGTSNSLLLEQHLKKELTRDLTTCEATRKISFSIQERSDYFFNQINSNRPGDWVICPVSIPLVQREHEVVMGYLLNRLRMFSLRAKKCSDNFETKENLARGLKRLTENRFGKLGEVIRSCKQENVPIDNSCMLTGLLKAGANEVITGLRFVKVENTVIPMIQVAKVLLFGLIDKSSQKWVEPSAKSACLPIKSLVGAKPVGLPQGQGNVLTQVQLVGRTKKNLQVSGKKMDFWTGKLDKLRKSPINEVFKLNDAVSVNTEPVYVSTTVAGAGLKYDVETKTISPVLIAQNMATYKV